MMDKEGLPHSFLTIPGTLRTNTKVVSLDGSDVTELVNRLNAYFAEKA